MNNKIGYLVGCTAVPLLLFGALLLVFSPATQAAAPATTMVVNTMEDELNNDGDCSLREAITAANDNTAVDACPAGDGVLTDTITFTVAGTITLSVQLSVTAGGPLLIDGGEIITVSGDSVVRVFWVSQGSDLWLQNFVVADGITEEAGRGGGLYNTGGAVHIANSTFIRNLARGLDCAPVGYYPGRGGGIANEGQLHITNSIFLDNSYVVCAEGGGIWNESVMTIENSTISGNLASGGGGIWNTYFGTASINNSSFNGNSGSSIRNHGAMTIENSTISGNSAPAGGGIWNESVMTIGNSTISGNSASIGGGIYNYGNMTLSGSSLIGNSASNGGGGIFHRQVGSSHIRTININNSTLSGNSADEGGGIQNIYGTVTIINTTINSNSANNGGGIANDGTMTITNSTVSGNSSSHGGGIYNVKHSSQSNLTMINSVVNDNSAITSGGGIYSEILLTTTNSIIAYSAYEDCFGPIASLGYNIAGDNTCNLTGTGDMNDTDPLLGPLQDNGGPTLTHQPLWNSPAIDVGDPLNCPETDQRGLPRPVDGDGDGTSICDNGSVEYQNPVSMTSLIIEGPTSGNVQSNLPFTATVSPISATTPIEYVWQAAGQAPVTHTGGISDSMTYLCETAGIFNIIVTATNMLNSVTTTTTVNILEATYFIYLPVAIKP